MLNPDAEEEDDEVWMWEDSSKFTVRSAFLRTNPNNIDVQDAAWMDVWKIGVASRIRMFIWLVKHKKIPCNAERKKRHLTDYGNCLSCANAWEDTEHVIHKCLYARYVWAKLMSNQALSRLDTLCFSKWINTNVTSDVGTKFGKNWLAVFSITCWWLWQWRNDLVFNNVDRDIVDKMS